MENFKIDLFEKETGELFPSFQKLNQTDCNICYQHFRKNIKVYDLHESVFDNFQSNGSFIEKYNALDDHFSLLELFADLNLCCDVICINWDEFKTIDVFRTIYGHENEMYKEGVNLKRGKDVCMRELREYGGRTGNKTKCAKG